jgi:hypothetical protein
LRADYAGFPPLPDLLQGYLWKLTGNINATNLLSVAVFAFYVATLHFLTRVPLAIIGFAIAAIPVVQTQIASSHVDNLANLSFSLGLVAAFILVTRPRRHTRSLYSFGVAGLALAANFKLPFVFLSSLALIPFTAIFWVKEIRFQSSKERVFYLLVFLIGAVAIGWLPLRSIILNGNPLYPIGFNILGYQLPGTEGPADYIYPIYLQGYPQILKWLLSVSEYHAYDFSRVPYSIAQGHPPTWAMSFRMGGYLFVYVFVSLLFFIVLTLRQRTTIKIGILATAGAITLLVALLPPSHELRYYSFWMISLVSCVLCMLWADDRLGELRMIYTILCLGCFWFVASITGYAYLKPQGFNMAWVANQIKFDEDFRPKIQPGKTYCLVDFGPYPIAVAPAFHPELGPYRIQVDDGPEHCDVDLKLAHPPALWLEYTPNGLVGLTW